MTTDKVSVHIDPSKQDQSIPEIGPENCPKCNVPYEVGFGMAGGGYGAYTYCPKCYAILSKTQDET